MPARVFKFRNLLNDSLYKNSIFLVLSRVLNMASGFFFWVLAARLYSIEEVGIATALISSLGLIILISRCGFDVSLIRYISSKNGVFNTCLSITTVFTVVISLGYFLSLYVLDIRVISNLLYALFFLIVAVVNSIAQITGNMFCALRKAHYYLLQNIIMSFRIFLLVPLIKFKAFGIFMALGTCYFLAAGVALLILSKEIKKYTFSVDKQFIKDSFKFSLGNFVSNNLYESPGLILPLMVLHFLGGDDVARYNLGFMISNLILVIPSALSTSLFVEGSHDQPLQTNIKKAGLTAILSIAPFATIIYVFGKDILGFINPDYVSALELLRLVVLTSGLATIHMIYLAVQNIKMKVNNNVKINLLRFFLLLGLSCFLMKRFGINGVGYAWLISYSVLILIIATKAKEQSITLLGDGFLKVLDTFKKINLETALMYTLFILVVLGMVGPIILKQYNFALLGSYLAVPMVIAPLIWIRCRNNEIYFTSYPQSLRYVLIAAFLLCYSLSIIILDIFQTRVIAYYLIIAVMSLLVVSQILLFDFIEKKQSMAVLVQTGLLMLNVIWGVNLKYFYFIGRTDIMTHSWLTENLLKLGYLSKVFEIYEAFPLWHILTVMVTKVSNISLPPYKVMFITNGIIYLMLILLVYLVVAAVLHSEKIALLSALFVCFNSEVIFYGMYSIPRSVILFIFVQLLFLLINRKDPLRLSLIVLTTIGLVMYHPASMPFILLILINLYILQKIYKFGKGQYLLNFSYLLLVLVITMTYWMYFGEMLFTAIVRNLFSTGPVGMLTKSIVLSPVSELLNYLHFSPLVFFIICGVLWVIRAKEVNSQAKIFFVLAFILIFLTFPGPALLINKMARNFNLSRIGEYSFIFISMAGAAGYYIVYYKSSKFWRCGLLCLYLIMSFLAVSNDFTATDNPLSKRPFYTFYFTENEILAFNHVAAITNGYLMADFPTYRYLENSSYSERSHIIEVNPWEDCLIKNRNSDTLLIRKGELGKRSLKLYTSTDGKFHLHPSLVAAQDYYSGEEPLWTSLNQYNQIYDSGEVIAVQ